MLDDKTNEGNQDRGEILREAKMAALTWHPTSHEAKEIAELLLNQTQEYALRHRLRDRRIRATAKPAYLAAMATWIADLIHHSANTKSEGFLYQPAEAKHFDGTFMGDRPFRFITDCWPRMGLMETVSNFDQSDDFEGTRVRQKRWAARYRATEGLLSFAKEKGIAPESLHKHFEQNKESFQWVRLKPDKRNADRGKRNKATDLKPDYGEAYLAQVEIVQRLNQFLALQDFTGVPQPELQRIFNKADDPDFAYDKGGRFCAIGPGHYQSLKDRSGIRINGSTVTELDIRASHLSIAYALLGESLNLSEDPYDVKQLPREAAKKVVVVTLSDGTPPTRWPNGSKEEISKAIGEDFTTTARKAADLVLAKHPCLARLSKVSLDWSKLQYLESEALRVAMEGLRDDLGIPALPVHDSLIVPEDATDVTEKYMKRAMLQVCGVEVEVRAKSQP